MKKVIHNIQTNEIVEIEMTVEEIEQLQKDIFAENERQQAKVEAEAKRAAAEAKLAALGLTSDDLKALGLN